MIDFAADVGNSCIKLCQFQNGAPRAFVRILHDGRLRRAAREAAAWLRKRHADRVFLAAVHRGAAARFQQELARPGIRCVRVKKNVPPGFRVRYRRGQLGIDRLANVLAARRLYRNRNIIVLDFGTALTADVIESSGHVGGFILPGPSVLFSNLAARTDRLPDASRTRRRFAVGADTRGAIVSGVMLQLKGGIAEIIRFVREKRKKRYAIVVTGGQARLAGLFGLRARENRTLTLSGIRTMGLK